jgi:hypothetical protein
VFQPEQGGRPILLREAMVKLQDAAGPVPDANQPSDTAAALPTFKIAQ